MRWPLIVASVVVTLGPAVPGHSVAPLGAGQPAEVGGAEVQEFATAPVPAELAAPLIDQMLDQASRSRFVQVPLAELTSALRETRIELELFPDVVLPLHSEHGVVSGANGSRTWSGLAANGDYATLTFTGGQVIGTAAANGVVYDIHPVSGTTHLITEEDPSAVTGRDEIVASGPSVTPDGEHGVETGAEAAGDPVVKVLNWYDDSALAVYGTHAATQAEMASIVNETNAAYARSEVQLTLSAVTEHVSYTSSGSGHTEIGRLRTPGDGHLDAVHGRRDAVDADLVSLITANVDFCGIANLGPGVDAAFSVVSTACDAYSHEIAHNLGAGHGAPDGGGHFAYSNGYRDGAHGFRTVMAYNSGSCAGGCSWIRYFSNPDVLYNGFPTGTPSHDNARTLNETAAIVAGFRPVLDVTGPTAEVRSPIGGARYLRDEVVTADFDCVDGAGGSGVRQCEASIEDGAPLDTASTGQHEFVVWGTDWAGNTSETIVRYRVYSITRRPDARIRAGNGPVVGNNAFNATPPGQTRTLSRRAGGAATFWVSLQNDGTNAADSLRVRGQRSTARIQVAYFSGSTNVTASVVAGTWTSPSLAPGAVHQLQMRVTPKAAAPVGSALTRTVTVSSVNEPATRDIVGAIVKRTR